MRTPLLLGLAAALLAGPLAAQTPTLKPAAAKAPPATVKPPPRVRGVRVLPPDQPAPIPAPAPPVLQEAAPTVTPAPAPTVPETVSVDLPAAAPPRCDHAFATADLTFSDAGRTSAAIRAALESRPETLVLDVPAFAPDAAPAWLAPWLNELQEAGGTIQQQAIPCGPRTRGGFFGKLLKRLFSPPPPESTFVRVRGYDAVFWTEKASGQVTQVQFKRKGA